MSKNQLKLQAVKEFILFDSGEDTTSVEKVNQLKEQAQKALENELSLENKASWKIELFKLTIEACNKILEPVN